MILGGVAIGSVVVAFVITIVELTEVVALVFALSADADTVRHGALGATAGVTVVALVALGAGAAVLRAPHLALLWASAVVLAAFGVFLFRSTLKTYRRSHGLLPTPPPRSAAALQFAGGFTVGAVEATEVVVVLLALTAGGQGAAAILGSVAGGVLLVAAAFAVHERMRRIKTAWLKLGATSMVFAFAAFWTGEALNFPWPGQDLFLVPLFVAALVLVRGAIAVGLRPRAPPSGAPTG
jgi:Ca2+/H+ antiporter, TMEM165/GDT1 family